MLTTKKDLDDGAAHLQGKSEFWEADGLRTSTEALAEVMAGVRSNGTEATIAIKVPQKTLGQTNPNAPKRYHELRFVQLGVLVTSRDEMLTFAKRLVAICESPQ